jgi:hypothetical protein
MALTACALLGGCDSAARGRIEAPALSPSDAADKALAEYDTNHDRLLDAGELEKCPPLKNSLEKFDRNGDGKLSAEEIAERFKLYRQSRIGLMTVVCQVYLDNHPLGGATVTFVPEIFLGPAFKPARGVSAEDGSVPLLAEGQTIEGVPCGLYRIEVSKKDTAGRELIPARYNAQTTLGQEVAPDMRGAVLLKLTSRDGQAASRTR